MKTVANRGLFPRTAAASCLHPYWWWCSKISGHLRGRLQRWRSAGGGWSSLGSPALCHGFSDGCGLISTLTTSASSYRRWSIRLLQVWSITNLRVNKTGTKINLTQSKTKNIKALFEQLEEPPLEEIHQNVKGSNGFLPVCECLLSKHLTNYWTISVKVRSWPEGTCASTSDGLLDSGSRSKFWIQIHASIDKYRTPSKKQWFISVNLPGKIKVC